MNATSWLIAGPIAYENFLSGWQMGWQICVAAVLIVVDRLSDVERPRLQLPIAAAAAVVASFSAAIGLVIWPCGLLVLIGGRAPRRAIVTWSALWAVTAAVFFFGYQNNGDPSQRAHSTGDALRYALTFLGSPLRGPEMSLETLQVVGGLLLIAFAFAVVAGRRVRTPAAGFWSWVALRVYALGGMVLTALTRSGIGVYQAQSPRYVAISQFLIVAIAGLLVPRALALRAATWRAAFALVAAVFVVSLAHSVQFTWVIWRDFDWHRAVALQGLARNDPATFWESYPDPVHVEKFLDALRTIDDGPLIERSSGRAP